jgi:ABC-type amino acid transport substrate-binding protein
MSNTRRPVFLALTALLLFGLAALPALASPARQTGSTPPTGSDWARIQRAGKIVVGTAADYEPFEFYASNYQLDGFDIALMQELGQRLGIEVVFKDFAFDGLLDALRLGQVDAVIAAVSVTPDRDQVVDFTNLYYIGEDAALARSDYRGAVRSATDLAGKRIGVQRGSTYQAWVQQNLVDTGLIPQADLATFQDTTSMVRDLRNGEIAVALMGKLPAQTLDRRFDDLKVVGEGFNHQRFAIATRADSTLIDPLNEALLQTQKDGAFARLAALYLGAGTTAPPAGGDGTATPTPTPAPTATPGPPPCIFGMAYVADLNYDDRNMTAPPVMAPGQQFTKRWRVRNSGTCAWEPDYQLSFLQGNRPGADMGGSAIDVGRRVEPGQTVDIAANLRAPAEYGTYQGFWKMRDNTGRSFGEVVWVGIQVPNPSPPPPPPPPPPAGINPNLRADSSWINAGQCTTVRWEVDNVNAVFFIDGGSQQGVGGHDARSVCPPATTTYVLRVFDRNNLASDFPITINVQGAAPGPSINFWVDNATINTGQCTTLHWDVQNVNAVFLNDQGVAGQSAQQVCPGSTTTYTLRVVRRDGGQETRQVTVTVVNQQPGPTINSFTVNTNQIRLGQCVTLSWSTSNAAGVNLSRGGLSLLNNWNANSRLDDCPSQPGLQEYQLDALGNGQTSQRLTVNVSPN